MKPIICTNHESHRHFDFPDFEKSVRIRFGAIKAYPPVFLEINSVWATLRSADKAVMKKIFIANKVATPELCEFPHKEKLPLVFKTQNHTRGRGMYIINTVCEIANNAMAGYFEKFVESDREFRIHVMGGRVFYADEKFLKDGHVASWIKNKKHGYKNLNRGNVPQNVLIEALKAVTAIGLDFAAVDVGYNTKTKEVYVFETNTAPGLRTRTRAAYRSAFIDFINKKL